MDVTRGRALALAGVVLFVVSMVASAMVAPSLGVASGASDETLVGIQGGGAGWHKYGEVRLYEGDRIAWQTTEADSYFDVQRTENGTVLAGFMDSGREDCGPYEPPCTVTGFQRIDPSGDSPEVVEEYSFPVRTAKNSETHDVEMLGEGEYLVSDMEHERIFIVEDGQTVWQWNASSFYDAPEDPTRTDWLHINDVDVIEEGRFLVSVRNANQIVVVERGSGVVEVINEDTDDSDDDACRGRGRLRDTDGDGDIRCGDPGVLDSQHNPQWLGDGAVLVADSHNDRVVELHRTENGSWEPAWSLESAEGVELNWPRDADRLPNGNTLVTDTLNRRIFEVNESGEVVWSVTMQQKNKKIPYEADRMPDNEIQGDLPRYEGGEVKRPGGKMPVVSTLLVGARAVYPGLPFWFRELQMLVTLLTVGLVLGGAVDNWRNGDVVVWADGELQVGSKDGQDGE